jgi:hypothetical protein
MATGPSFPATAGRSIGAVHDPKVEVQGCTYLVLRERELHAVAAERTEHGTGLYL